MPIPEAASLRRNASTKPDSISSWRSDRPRATCSSRAVRPAIDPAGILRARFPWNAQAQHDKAQPHCRPKSRQPRCGAANIWGRNSLFAHHLVTRDRSADHASLSAIHALAQAGDHAKAATLAEASLADGLEHPLVYNLAALKFEQ